MTPPHIKEYTVFCKTCSETGYLRPEQSQITTMVTAAEVVVRICGHVTFALCVVPVKEAEPCQT